MKIFGRRNSGGVLKAVTWLVYRELERARSLGAARFKAELPPSDFYQLIDRGYCYYKFRNNRDLLFVLRAQKSAGTTVQVNVDAIELSGRRLVALIDFEIFTAKRSAVMEAQVNLDQAELTPEAKQVLLASGFSRAELDPSSYINFRWLPAEDALAAFWIRAGYRGKANAGDNGLSHILMSTALRFIKCFGVSVVELREIGNDNVAGNRAKLRGYYAREFGAKTVDQPENMVIEL